MYPKLIDLVALCLGLPKKLGLYMCNTPHL